MKYLTVGELREIIKDIPDNTPVMHHMGWIGLVPIKTAYLSHKISSSYSYGSTIPTSYSRLPFLFLRNNIDMSNFNKVEFFAELEKDLR